MPLWKQRKKFQENFVTKGELDFVTKVIIKKLSEKSVKIEIKRSSFEKYFTIKNGIIIKNEETLNCGFDNKITKYGDIPSEIRDFKMHSHELIVEENNPIIKDYSYSEVESNGIKVFVRNICKKDNTNAFLKVLKKYYDYSLEFVDTNE